MLKLDISPTHQLRKFINLMKNGLVLAFRKFDKDYKNGPITINHTGTICSLISVKLLSYILQIVLVISPQRALIYINCISKIFYIFCHFLHLTKFSKKTKIVLMHIFNNRSEQRQSEQPHGSSTSYFRSNPGKKTCLKQLWLYILPKNCLKIFTILFWSLQHCPQPTFC